MRLQPPAADSARVLEIAMPSSTNHGFLFTKPRRVKTSDERFSRGRCPRRLHWHIVIDAILESWMHNNNIKQYPMRKSHRTIRDLMLFKVSKVVQTLRYLYHV